MNSNELHDALVRESVEAGHRHIDQMIAVVREEEPAKIITWYLPLTGREHIEYPDREAAARAAVRLCVQMGLPIVTPLSKRTA